MKCPKCQADNPETKQFCGDCGTQLTSPAEAQPSFTKTIETAQEELATGSVFANRYQVIEELGKGGMGKVYRVLDKKLNEEVALKLIKPEIASDRKTLERFKNELKLARKVAQKNVGKMFDLGEETGTHYITMEYVPGEDLKSSIRRFGQLPIGKSISIAKQLCEGLSEAHGIGIVHRDLKPSNIMIDKAGNARIMDFGIARSMEAKKLTGAGVIIGTPEYMSPEQVEGKETDQRSDIYSLGVILYEMLTGRLPFEGDTPLSIAVQHRSDTPRDPAEFNQQIPADLGTAILKCLEKDKAARYQTAKGLLSSLAQIEQGIPTTEQTAPRTKPTTSKEITVTLSKRRIFTLAALAIVIIAAAAFLFLRDGKELAPEEAIKLVVLPFENRGEPGDQQRFVDDVSDAIRNRLGFLKGLKVISSESAVQYKDSNKTTSQIRRELNVDYIVKGTVSWDPGADEKRGFRVSPELINAADDTQVWSHYYDKDYSLGDIFGVQAEIAEEIARQLDLKILKPERMAMRANPTDNHEAYECYLRGKALLEQAVFRLFSEEISELALAELEKAIKLDPAFVEAYCFISRIHSTAYGLVDRTEERREAAKAAVDEARKIQPESPAVFRALALYYSRCEDNQTRALEVYESALKAYPNKRFRGMGNLQRQQGKWKEALETYERVIELDPLHYATALQMGRTLAAMRRYEEAETCYNKSLQLEPSNQLVPFLKSTLYLDWNGNTRESRKFLRELPPGEIASFLQVTLDRYDRDYDAVLSSLNSFPSDVNDILGTLYQKDVGYARVYHATGEADRMKSHAKSAIESLEDLEHERGNPRYWSLLGEANAYLGRKNEAIRLGNQAVGLLPIAKDAMDGPGVVMDLIHILIIVGEYDEAIDRLDYLMSIEAGSDISAARLRTDPRFDTLQDNTKFKALLEKYPIEN